MYPVFVSGAFGEVEGLGSGFRVAGCSFIFGCSGRKFFLAQNKLLKVPLNSKPASPNSSPPKVREES